MSEDTDLARLFAQTADPSGSDAFVAGVTGRIARRRRLRLAAPTALIAALLLAVWATRPAAKTFAVTSLGSVDLLAHGISGFFTSDIGTAVAAALTLSLAIWAFATGRLRSFFR
jgi:hypothetical protein